MDDARRAALDKRAALLADTRAAVTRELESASATLQRDAAGARAALDRETTDLAGAIVARVLGRAS
jgi:F0F1-type ATP synthase membrane subunit b/b'